MLDEVPDVEPDMNMSASISRTLVQAQAGH